MRPQPPRAVRRQRCPRGRTCPVRGARNCALSRDGGAPFARRGAPRQGREELRARPDCGPQVVTAPKGQIGPSRTTRPVAGPTGCAPSGARGTARSARLRAAGRHRPAGADRSVPDHRRVVGPTGCAPSGARGTARSARLRAAGRHRPEGADRSVPDHRAGGGLVAQFPAPLMVTLRPSRAQRPPRRANPSPSRAERRPGRGKRPPAVGEPPPGKGETPPAEGEPPAREGLNAARGGRTPAREGASGGGRRRR